ncbi:MAG TPA: cupin fold metalloprotein, WbuC family [Morganella sp. (in: Bacteria)]|nr:cupin fold metalloprotein, WbuC family [Morganella sp. (in: enterobacteria)]
MKVVDNLLIETLYTEAKNNQRKRSHHLLHNSHDDKVQRLLIALIKDSFVEPHYHELPHQWELFFILDGSVELTLYSSDNVIDNIIVLGKKSGIYSIELPPTQIHSLKCISDTALLLEVKEGPFDPNFAKKLI